VSDGAHPASGTTLVCQVSSASTPCRLCQSRHTKRRFILSGRQKEKPDACRDHLSDFLPASFGQAGTTRPDWVTTTDGEPWIGDA